MRQGDLKRYVRVVGGRERMPRRNAAATGKMKSDTIGREGDARVRIVGGRGWGGDHRVHSFVRVREIARAGLVLRGFATQGRSWGWAEGPYDRGRTRPSEGSVEGRLKVGRESAGSDREGKGISSPWEAVPPCVRADGRQQMNTRAHVLAGRTRLINGMILTEDSIGAAASLEIIQRRGIKRQC